MLSSSLCLMHRAAYAQQQALPARLQGRLQAGGPGQPGAGLPLLAPEDLAEQRRLKEERIEAELARARKKAEEDRKRAEVRTQDVPHFLISSTAWV